MEWYYVDGGKQAGPVTDEQLEELRLSGKVLPETQIWRPGMENWQPYRLIKPENVPAAPVTFAPNVPAPTNLAPDEVVCAECGKVFKASDTIQHGNARVCAGCKPMFLQKIAEGAHIGGGLNYASFGLRFGAYFLDGIILYAVNTGISLIAGLTPGQAVGVTPATRLTTTLILFFVQMAVGISYDVIMVGKYGATLGKMACKIKIVTAEGQRVSYARALGRYFAKLLSALPCLIGFFMAAFDEEKRALHDRICNTRVVMKQ